MEVGSLRVEWEWLCGWLLVSPSTISYSWEDGALSSGCGLVSFGDRWNVLGYVFPRSQACCGSERCHVIVQEALNPVFEGYGMVVAIFTYILDEIA